MTIDEFFAGEPRSRAVYDRLRRVMQGWAGVSVRASKSQVSFRRRTAFASAWIPGRYLRGQRPPLVLTLHFRKRRPWARWKEVVEAAPGRFTHHLELTGPEEVDEEVEMFLRAAWESAGDGSA